MAANEASSVGSLRAYNTAIVNYAAKCPDQGYPASTANLGPGSGDCAAANLVDQMLGSAQPSKSGYVFHYRPGIRDNLGRVTSYAITADPIQQDTTGVRHFFTDESGVIRVERNRTASEESTPLQ
jgi:hypothetical protein